MIKASRIFVIFAYRKSGFFGSFRWIIRVDKINRGSLRRIGNGKAFGDLVSTSKVHLCLCTSKVQRGGDSSCQHCQSVSKGYTPGFPSVSRLRHNFGSPLCFAWKKKQISKVNFFEISDFPVGDTYRKSNQFQQNTIIFYSVTLIFLTRI